MDLRRFAPRSLERSSSSASSARTFDTLAAWRAGMGFDLASRNADPLFVNRSSRNYRLAIGSPGLSAGRYGDNIGAYPTGSEVIGPTGLAPTGGSAAPDGGANAGVLDAGHDGDQGGSAAPPIGSPPKGQDATPLSSAPTSDGCSVGAAHGLEGPIAAWLVAVGLLVRRRARRSSASAPANG